MGQVIPGDHWSCCGARAENAEGCEALPGPATATATATAPTARRVTAPTAAPAVEGERRLTIGDRVRLASGVDPAALVGGQALRRLCLRQAEDALEGVIEEDDASDFPYRVNCGGVLSWYRAAHLVRAGAPRGGAPHVAAPRVAHTGSLSGCGGNPAGFPGTRGGGNCSSTTCRDCGAHTHYTCCGMRAAAGAQCPAGFSAAQAARNVAAFRRRGHTGRVVANALPGVLFPLEALVAAGLVDGPGVGVAPAEAAAAAPEAAAAAAGGCGRSARCATTATAPAWCAASAGRSTAGTFARAPAAPAASGAAGAGQQQRPARRVRAGSSSARESC